MGYPERPPMTPRESRYRDTRTRAGLYDPLVKRLALNLPAANTIIPTLEVASFEPWRLSVTVTTGALDLRLAPWDSDQYDWWFGQRPAPYVLEFPRGVFQFQVRQLSATQLVATLMAVIERGPMEADPESRDLMRDEAPEAPPAVGSPSRLPHPLRPERTSRGYRG